MGERRFLFIVLFFAFMFFPVLSHAAQGTLTDEAKVCLACHSNQELTKQLESKEILSLYIDGPKFTDSIHNTLGCSGCHMDISMENHPLIKKIMSRRDYTESSSKGCKVCHPEEMLKKKPMHGKLMAQAKAPTCSECHGSHYIRGIPQWKTDVTEPQYCLTCHRYNITMSFKSGELLPLSIDQSAFKNSVHKNLTCSVCHRGISKSEHPIRVFKSKREYTANVSKACLMCHPEELLSRKPIHSSLMARASCVECHGSHYVMGIFAQKTALKENQYCLNCHKHDIRMTLKNGESLSLFVDESGLRNSVHNNLKCRECHLGFSSVKHPAKVYNSRREYSISAGKVCGSCHSEADKQYKSSIHLTFIKKGDNLHAAACSDCHGFHSVTKTGEDLGLTSCNKCHGDLNSSYEASVHNKARIKGKKDAPLCSSCHNAHNIESTKMTTKIKEGCFKCHTDMEKVHSKWLKNPPITLSTFTEAHFDVVSCAACHSPDATRRIYLNLFDSKTAKPLTMEEIVKTLDTNAEGLTKIIDANGNGSIEGQELWNLFWFLSKKGESITFMGKIDVSNASEAHQLGTKAEATRACDTCHHPGSKYFENVFVVINKTGGKTTVFPAEKGILSSVYTIVPVRKFYAIGGTNIRLFDILFYVALLGGIAVPIGHITFRIITSPIRSLRRMGKGGRK